MKNEKTLGIGITQRVPLEILTRAITQIVEYGEFSRSELTGIVNEHDKGDNRKAKVERTAAKIVFGSKKYLDALKSLLDLRTITGEESKLLAIALSAIAFPSFHVLLTSLAQQFRVQETVNRAFINKVLYDRYGSSSSTEHGVDAVMPMLVEAGVLVRKSLGTFTKGALPALISKEVCEFWVLTDLKVSRNKSIAVDDLVHRPWSDYCPDVLRASESPKMLTVENLLGSKAYLKMDPNPRNSNLEQK